MQGPFIVLEDFLTCIYVHMYTHAKDFQNNKRPLRDYLQCIYIYIYMYVYIRLLVYIHVGMYMVLTGV